LLRERLTDVSSHLLSLLRVVAGFTFALYGAKLLFGVLGGADDAGHAASILSLFGIAGVLEFIGGTLLRSVFLPGRPHLSWQDRWQ
jgi:putative oxidoreductase